MWHILPSLALQIDAETSIAGGGQRVMYQLVYGGGTSVGKRAECCFISLNEVAILGSEDGQSAAIYAQLSINAVQVAANGSITDD